MIQGPNLGRYLVLKIKVYWDSAKHIPSFKYFPWLLSRYKGKFETETIKSKRFIIWPFTESLWTPDLHGWASTISHYLDDCHFTVNLEIK
jgi:hypothetical protein